MKLPNLYTILAVLLITNLPMVAKSDGLVIHSQNCPAQALISKSIREFTVTYSNKISTNLQKSVIVDAHTDLAAYWKKQLAESARFRIEVIDLQLNGNTARLAAFGAVSGEKVRTLD